MFFDMKKYVYSENGFNTLEIKYFSFASSNSSQFYF